MKRLVDLYFALLRGIVAVLLAGMVVLVFGNVVLRYAANSGIPVSEELSRWFFVWLVFLGSIVALRDHQHLGRIRWCASCRCWAARGALHSAMG